ncbi:MAG TPA: tetratricopeptide repeat protein [Burkholderiales bacterium]|nr:tetratricopeptide repeat protein [Burkholderiales bacterium]
MKVALLGLAVIAAHAVSLLAAFQFDDYNVIVRDPAVHDWGALAQELARGLRPVLKASYTLSWTLGDGGPAAFAAFNVLVHALNTVLLYFIGLRLAARWKPGAEAAVLFAALLFALHPVQTEAVTYASGRSTSLAAAFYLGALLVYLRHGPLWASLFLFVLACGTKETALVLPAALLLCDRGFVRRQAPFWVLALAFLVAALLHERYARFFEFAFSQRSVAENLLTQVQGIGYLVSRLFLPHRLNIDPALPPLFGWDAALAFQGAALAALLLLGVLSFRRRPWIAFGVLWFFVHLAPTNSLVPRVDVANERQLYLAWWGLAFALSVQCSSFPWRRTAAAAMLAVLGVLSVMRQIDYRSESALWEASVREAPWNPRAHNNLGYARMQAGDVEGAIRAYREALAFDPRDGTARYNLEEALSARARTAPADSARRPPGGG